MNIAASIVKAAKDGTPDKIPGIWQQFSALHTETGLTDRLAQNEKRVCHDCREEQPLNRFLGPHNEIRPVCCQCYAAAITPPPTKKTVKPVGYTKLDDVQAQGLFSQLAGGAVLIKDNGIFIECSAYQKIIKELSA